ncbi:MAG: baseplate J/gp47 family protein [Solirubrobacteraceae bacterium]
MSTQLDPLDPDNPFRLPITVDPDEIRQDLHAELQSRVTDWQPVDTALDTQLIAAVAEIEGEARQAFDAGISDRLAELIGELHNLPRLDGVPSSSTITATAKDLLGHTALAGMTVWIGDVELATTTDLVIPPGEDTGTVTVSAAEPGAHTNGVDGDPETDALDWLASTNPVILDAPLTGGVDPEDDLTYKARLVGELTDLSRLCIRPEDFARRALRHPDVGIAWTIDHYDASTDTSGALLTNTTVIAGEDGEPVPPSSRLAVAEDLQERAITDLAAQVVDPLYETIDVTGTVVVRAGWDPIEVCAATAARLQLVLSPAQRAAPLYGHEVESSPERVVHVNELIAQADQVDGVVHPDTMEIGDGSSPSVTLDSPRTLTRPGTITITEAT